MTAPTLPRTPEDSNEEKEIALTPQAARAAARRAVILEGNIHRGVFAIALPSVATMMLQTTNAMLDAFFVGQLGPDAVAAITVSSSVMFALMSAVMAISVGTTALVARFVGERNEEEAVIATRQSLVLSLVLSLAVGLPIYFLRHSLLQVLGLQGGAFDQAERYLALSILGLPSLFVMLILNGAFRGLGDTMRPFWVSLIGNLVHIAFNYLLIFGHLGFPRMGIAGGAVALVLSQVAQTFLYIYWMRHTTIAHALHGPYHLHWAWAHRICRIGIPAALQQFARVGSMLAFQGMLARTPEGAAAVAAIGLGLRSESIAFMPGFGYSIAASAFVGQNLGAKQPDRADAGAWSATWQAVGVMTVMGILFATFAEPFAHAFLRHGDGESAATATQIDLTIRLTAAYLQIALWSEPFLAFGMVLNGALQGAGDTVAPTVLTILTQTVLRLTLAYLFLFVFGFGVAGAWWAMSISTIVGGILTIQLFRTGKWRHTQV
ncbi:MAG: MATE family efflux transporter [Capsulimonadales bacterium]|nr:MATE family efflux transporter [Capsulimonadales bacterium]